MSMPKFPQFDPEITCEHSLNMILASIAMEELAISHIINAEGEKLQYVLGTLETGGCVKPDIDEVLKVNQSVACLMDSISQNQMILKTKWTGRFMLWRKYIRSHPYHLAHPNLLVHPGHQGRAVNARANAARVFKPQRSVIYGLQTPLCIGIKRIFMAIASASTLTTEEESYYAQKGGLCSILPSM